MFYSDILQGMRTWTAPVPRLREEIGNEPVAEQLISSAISSQDGPEESSAPIPVVLPGPGAEGTAVKDVTLVDARGPAIADARPAEDIPLEVALHEDPAIVNIKPTEVPVSRHPSRRELRLLPRMDPSSNETCMPGWYCDPDAESQLRWWNGMYWSNDVYTTALSLNVSG